MFIWTAIDINDELKHIAPQIKQIEDEMGFKNSTLLLPFHLSLKISFNLAERFYDRAIEAIIDYYKLLKPFEIEVDKIEIENGIVWIRFKQNEILKTIHAHFDAIMQNKFDVKPHEYDLDFKFHTTLFIDADKHKIQSAYQKIKNIDIPKRFKVSKFLIGESNTGEIGSYKVTRSIQIC